MKRLLVLITAVSLILNLSVNTVNINAAEPEITAKSAILMEASTGKIIYEKNSNEVLRPASITKIMTLLLIFDSLASNEINLSDNVTVSEYAASMGGSQVFLEAGETQTVETLMKCIAIASANDACVAMAEYISGSEATFVKKMNERAFGLNMKNTNFINCCGLDVDNHVTTATDVAIMTRELINKYPEIHDISTIWMDTITHVTRRGEQEFVLNNTNKLLKQYEWATGLKTGSTSLAGFCLSATAKRNNIELISVVMCSSDGKARVNDSIALLNYGYGLCKLYKCDAYPELLPVKIKNGIKSEITGSYAKDFSYIFTYDADLSRITFTTEYLTLSAPIDAGQTIGQISFYYDNEFLGSVDIISSEKIEKANWCDFLYMAVRKLFAI